MEMQTLLWFIFTTAGVIAVPIRDFFPFGPDSLDNRLEENDDGSTEEIYLIPSVFPYGDQQETKLWVNNNGDITFHGASNTFNPICDSFEINQRRIAAFWADVDTRQGGTVFYRQSSNLTLLEKATAEIMQKYPHMIGISISWIFIATWFEVAPYGDIDDQRNTFQLILATDGTVSFAIMYYHKITWSFGNNGYAKVGFDIGHEKNFIKIPGSCTPDIVNIQHESNMNVPGKYIFRVDGLEISTAKCDDTLYYAGKEKLQVSPSYVDTMGHVLVEFRGPCFPSSVRIICTFFDNVKGPIQVNGMVVLRSTLSPTVSCRTPYFYGLGRTEVNVTVIDDLESKTYSAYLYVTSHVPSVQLNMTQTASYSDGTVMGNLDFTWRKDMIEFKDVSHVDITMIWFDHQTIQFKDLLIIGSSLANIGYVRLNYHSAKFFGLVNMTELARSFLCFSINAKQILSSENNVSIQVSPFLNEFRIFTDFFTGRTMMNMTVFDLSDSTMELPSCPCTESQAMNDHNFMKHDSSLSLMDFFYKRGHVAYRTSTPLPMTHASQLCIYNTEGHLLVGPPNGGTAGKYSPNYSTSLHFYHDVIPWVLYCSSSLTSLCHMYYEKRTSDSCDQYRPPSTSQAYGDPHFITFDKLNYTFNGAGEFRLMETIDGEFAVQVRMEQLGYTKATVLTAFALRYGQTTVQIEKTMFATVYVLVDGYPTYFKNSQSKSQTFNREVTITASKDDLSLITMCFGSSIALIISTSEDVMSFTGVIHQQYKGKLRGLLGNFDGNPKNDLMNLNGTFIRSKSRLSMIHWQFGMSWMVEENETFFKYPIGKSYFDYSRSHFAPRLRQPDPQKLSEEALQLCGTSENCLFDYFVTGGDLVFANQTLIIERRFHTMRKTFDEKVRKCPSFQRLVGGHATHTDGIFLGSIVTFECESGRTLIGESSIVCLHVDENETHWNGTTPICIVEEPKNRQDIFIGIAVVCALIFLLIIILICVLQRNGQKKKKKQKLSNEEEVTEFLPLPVVNTNEKTV